MNILIFLIALFMTIILGGVAFISVLGVIAIVLDIIKEVRKNDADN